MALMHAGRTCMRRIAESVHIDPISSAEPPHQTHGGYPPSYGIFSVPKVNGLESPVPTNISATHTSMEVNFFSSTLPSSSETNAARAVSSNLGLDETDRPPRQTMLWSKLEGAVPTCWFEETEGLR